jgi:MFS-type transporter involved in bile tolerance (Atg22 family)
MIQITKMSVLRFAVRLLVAVVFVHLVFLALSRFFPTLAEAVNPFSPHQKTFFILGLIIGLFLTRILDRILYKVGMLALFLVGCVILSLPFPHAGMFSAAWFFVTAIPMSIWKRQLTFRDEVENAVKKWRRP